MKKTEKEAEFLFEAREQFARLRAADEHNRKQARKNYKFIYVPGAQWSVDDRDQRKEDGRPCLSSNQLRKFVSGLANMARDQRIAGNVRPVDDEGDVDVANIIAGLIRQIEYVSGAETIYTDAAEDAIAGGTGYIRLKTEEKDDSFDQELFIEGIRNPLAVTLDPDGMYGFIEEKISKKEFKHRYPDAIEESVDPAEEYYSLWFPDEDHLFIREYFYKERVRTKIVQARKLDESGQLVGEAKIFDLRRDKLTEDDLVKAGWSIEKSKTPKKFVVKWAKISATQILKEGEWVGDEIPIVPVKGDWKWIDGVLYKRNLTIDAHDDQRMYNFWLTSLAERYTIASKAPYLVTKKMVEGLTNVWKFAHKKLFPYLAYNHDKAAPGGPRREQSPQVSTGESSMLGVHKQNIMDTIGRYEASFGQKSNERSKVAIDARANRGAVSTFHFPDNLRRSIVELVRMMINCIPRVYDTQRTVRILGEDRKQAENVTLNHFIGLDDTGAPIILNNFLIGKYDVIAAVKLMSTRRQEQLAGMQALAGGNPMLGVFLAGDIAKLQDWDGAQELAAKIDKNLPALLGIKPENPEAQPEGETGDGGL